MQMHSEFQNLLSLGPLPPESASASEIELRQTLIQRIDPPVSLPEAVALAGILGPDDCFGLAWTVVHLIESAPGWSAAHVPTGQSPFLPTLIARSNNAVRGVSPIG